MTYYKRARHIALEIEIIPIKAENRHYFALKSNLIRIDITVLENDVGAISEGVLSQNLPISHQPLNAISEMDMFLD